MKELIHDRREMEKSIEKAVKTFMEKHGQYKVNGVYVHSKHVKSVKTELSKLADSEIRTEIHLL